MDKRNITITDSEIEEIMNQRKSFLIYKDKIEMIKYMNDSEIAVFWRAIYQDRVERVNPMLEGESPLVQAAFSQMQAAFKNDDEQYIQRVIKNRINGQKGGRPRKTNGLYSVNDKTISNPQKADTDTDTDTDTGTDKYSPKKPKKKDKFKNFNGRNYSDEDYVDFERVMPNKIE